MFVGFEHMCVRCAVPKEPMEMWEGGVGEKRGWEGQRQSGIIVTDRAAP